MKLMKDLMQLFEESTEDDLNGLWALMIFALIFDTPKDTLIIDIKLGDEK